jgi:choline dehydrogenase-like flavoprotein
MPTYDYVIVGAGSAGCVLAARLSEDPAVKVLLVEAGPPDTSDLIHLPAAFSALFRTQHDWDHMTAWEPGLNGRRVYLPRGRTLGGSSSLNAIVYIRGNRADYDEWAAQGCPGWSYDDLLPYFMRAEDNERAGRTSITAPAVRCRCRTAARGARRAPRSSRRPTRSACLPTPTSTAPRRTASAGTRSPSAPGAAPAPRSPICIRRATARTSRC